MEISLGFRLALLLILLASSFIYSWVLLRKTKSKENYLFFGFNLLLLTTVYSVSALKVRISGANLGIEIKEEVQKATAAKEQAAESAKSAADIAATLTKMSFVVADGASRFGGVPQEHKKLLKKYSDSLTPYYRGDINSEVEEAIKRLNDEIHQRHEREKK